MEIVVTGKQVDTGESFRRRAHDVLTEVAGKYFFNPIDGAVTLSRDGAGFKVDVTVHVGRDITVHGHSTSDKAETALDRAVDRIEKRLRRFKRRLRDHHVREHHADADARYGDARYTVLAAADAEPSPEATEVDEEWRPMVVADMQTAIETLSVEEAVMRLELGGGTAIMFKNGSHGGLNTEYRRADGNIGWIDPEGRSADRLGAGS